MCPPFADGTRSVLVHPLSNEQQRDHEFRNAWMGTPWPLYLEELPTNGEIPLQYPELGEADHVLRFVADRCSNGSTGLGRSTTTDEEPTFEKRGDRGSAIEKLLAGNPEAAPAPRD